MSHNTTALESTRLEYVDGLKVLMILCVLFCHLSEYLGIKFNEFWQFFWSTCGAVGVSGFIILSGFGLTYSMLVSNVTDIIVRPFFWKRFFRIVPLYYLALFTYFLIVDLIEPSNFFAHLFLLHTFFKNYSHNPGSLWFIGLIVQCYLVFPLAYKIMRQKRGLFLLSIAAVLLYSLGIILENEGFYVSDSFLSFVIEFFLGMNMARQAYRGKFERYSAPIVVILAIIELGLFFIFVKTSLLFRLSYYIYFPIITLSKICFFLVALNVLLIIQKRFQYFQRFVPLLYVMSLASYSVYLFHRPILTVLTKGSAWNWIVSHAVSESVRFICLSIVSIPLVFLISYWIQRSYDSVQKKLIFTQFYPSLSKAQVSSKN